MKKYSEDMIREAVDVAVGDDGYRSNEVMLILKHLTKKVGDDVQALDDYYLSLQE